MLAVAQENERRALMLLHLVDPETRETILAALPADLRTGLRERVQKLARPRSSTRKVEQLIGEFARLFQFAEKIRGPRPRRFSPEAGQMEQADDWELTGNPTVDLEQMNLDQLAAALEEEHPRTTAILLQSLSTDRVSRLIQRLSPSQQHAVVRELARRPQSPEIVFERMARATIQRAATQPKVKPKEVDPILRIADVFRQIDKVHRRELIETIREDNADVASELQQALYRFDDLLDLEDRQVQEILAKIDSGTLQDALFEAEPSIVEKIMKNLSRRAEATLREELTYQKPVSPTVQKAARAVIANVIGTVDGDAP